MSEEFNALLDSAGLRLDALFEKAKSYYMKHFPEVANDWLHSQKAYFGIIKYMGYLVELLNLEYYYASLNHKKKELLVRLQK